MEQCAPLTSYAVPLQCPAVIFPNTVLWVSTFSTFCLRGRLLHLSREPLGDLGVKNVVYLVRARIENAQQIAKQIKASNRCSALSQEVFSLSSGSPSSLSQAPHDSVHMIARYPNAGATPTLDFLLWQQASSAPLPRHVSHAT